MNTRVVQPSPHEVAPVLCVGESMIVGFPVDGRDLARASRFTLDVAGAESNVACALASLGIRTQWWSRLGNDPFGDRLLATLDARGVDLDGVFRDERRPTGMYWKDPNADGTSVYYYRAGSAASVMSDADLGALALDQRQLIHVTGVTAAISNSASGLVSALMEAAVGAVRSFDVNYRPSLWPDRPTAGRRLRALADRADVVFVGLDEARALWGCSTPLEVRVLLPGPANVVVKDGPIAAHSFTTGPDGDSYREEPAPSVTVVEPVGAGDAFAAGYLSGLLRHEDPGLRLRRGHVMASAALTNVSDTSERWDHATVTTLAQMDPADWARLYVSPTEYGLRSVGT
jgi:2-dehydro-3-deoxygluconokinase